MNKEEIFNEISSCFKMSVDMNGMKKLEEYITNLQQQNQKYKEVIDKLKKEVDKIFVEGQIINRCLLLSIYENIWRILKEVSE